MLSLHSPDSNRIGKLLAVLAAALSYDVHSISVPSEYTDRLTTASGLPVARYALGGAARSSQPYDLPMQYYERVQRKPYGEKGDMENSSDGSAAVPGAPFYFYYNPHRYPAFMAGVSDLCDSEAISRTDLFVASGGTDREIEELDQRLADALEYCGGDYLDCFILEYICPDEMIHTSTKENNNDDDVAVADVDSLTKCEVGLDLQAAIEHTRHWVTQGKVRYVGISTHSHVIGAALANNPGIDVLMLRYSMSHKLAAESLSFPSAKNNGNKPVIAFTTTRWNSLQREEEGITTADCLSFAFNQRASPPVEIVLHSARDEDELEEAMSGMRFSLNNEEEMKLRAYGDSIEASNLDSFDEYPDERWNIA